MRIEILIDGSVDPQIYPINKPKLTLGSGETCDVVISSDNISRKHLIIVNEGDSFFVIDQGSTNGSFINEERLVPGRRTEFTSFFPVRLGDQVLITLLSDDEQGAGSDEPMIPLFPKEGSQQASRGADESTRLISLADLKKAKTSDLVQKRADVIKKKATPPKKLPVKTKRAKENDRFKTMVWISVLAIGAVGYYNIKEKKEEAKNEIMEVGQVVKVEPTQATKDKIPETASTDTASDQARIIPEAQLLEKDKYLQLLVDAKCVTEMEKYFCEKIPYAKGGSYGAVQIGSTMHIVIDGDPYIKEAREYVVHPPADSSGNYPPEVYEPYKKVVMDVAIVIFLMKGIPADFDWEKIKDLKISIGIYETWQGTTYIQRVGAGYPERLKKFREVVTIENLKNVKVVGENALLFTKDYYRTY